MSEFDKFWTEQPGSRRIILLIALIVALAIPIFIVVMMHDREDVVLYDGLAEEDAARLADKLNSLKIEYTLGNNGQAIYVDDQKVDDIRLQLVGEGLKPGNGVGYEIFDSLGYGVSDFAQRIHYQRAMQGELARSIMALKAVQSARVLLVLPEEKLFEKQSKNAKASVILTLHENARLSEAQIDGIQQLVASSVKGLDSEEVVISDERGILLTSAARQSKNQATMLLNDKTRLEQHLADKCDTILAHVFGSGNAVVNVDVSLAISEVNETRETVLTPNEKSSTGILVQRKHSVTRKTGNEQEGRRGSSVVQETNEDVYQTGKLIETKVKKPGDIVRISVSALVPTDVSDEQLQSIRQLLAATAGIDPSRGDMLAVERLPTYAPEVRTAAAPESMPLPSSLAVADEHKPESNLMHILQSYRYPLIGLFLTIMAICCYLLFRKQATYPLEHAEKEQLLLEIKDWLAEDKRLTGTGA